MAVTAVQAGAAAVETMMATTDSSTPQAVEGESRFNPHWRMAPGAVALLGSTVASVCAVVWQYYSLLTFFVPAAGCSIYAISLGHDFQHLHSFGENNERFKESVSSLEEKNKELEKQVTQFKSSITDLSTENSSLKDSNIKFQKSITELETLRDTLHKKASFHVEQLDVLQKGLKMIQTTAKDDHSSFGQTLKLFIGQVEALQKTRAEFESTGSHVEEAMKSQVETMLSTTSTLKEIFEEIKEWKDEKAVQIRLDMQQQLGQQVAQLQGQLGENRGQIEAQRKHIEEMNKIKDGFNGLLAQLLEAAEQMKGSNGALAEQVKKVAETFQQYELKTPK